MGHVRLEVEGRETLQPVAGRSETRSPMAEPGRHRAQGGALGHNIADDLLAAGGLDGTMVGARCFVHTEMVVHPLADDWALASHRAPGPQRPELYAEADLD